MIQYTSFMYPIYHSRPPPPFPPTLKCQPTPPRDVSSALACILLFVGKTPSVSRRSLFRNPTLGVRRLRTPAVGCSRHVLVSPSPVARRCQTSVATKEHTLQTQDVTFEVLQCVDDVGDDTWSRIVHGGASTTHLQVLVTYL